MKDKHSAGSFALLLLFFFFMLGAAVEVLCKERMGRQLFPAADFRWLAAILALDAVMTCSLLAGLVLLPATLFLGAIAATELFGISEGNLAEVWGRAALLAAVLPIHFAVAGRNMRTASQLRYTLQKRENTARMYTAAVLTMIGTLLGCFLMLLLAQGACI